MSDIHSAEPGDIYADVQGKLWRVIGVCSQPTVELEEVEPSGHSTDPQRTQMLGGLGVLQTGVFQPTGHFIRRRQRGGVGGLMWEGFKRIWRSEGKTP